MTTVTAVTPETKPVRSRRRPIQWGNIGVHAFLITMAVVWLFPVLWAFYIALRSFADTTLNVLTGTDITKAGAGTYAPGNYYYTVSGVGTAGAEKAGAYSFAVVTSLPVPEPETYAMLLAGLGLLGTIARRRKSKAV